MVCCWIHIKTKTNMEQMGLSVLKLPWTAMCSQAGGQCLGSQLLYPHLIFQIPWMKVWGHKNYHFVPCPFPHYPALARHLFGLVGNQMLASHKNSEDRNPEKGRAILWCKDLNIFCDIDMPSFVKVFRSKNQFTLSIFYMYNKTPI